MAAKGSSGTIAVRVKVFGGLSQLVNSPAFDVSVANPSNVGDIIRAIRKTSPPLAEKLAAGLKDGYINILLNGRNVRFLDGMQTQLAAGSTVAFIPPIGGG